MDPVFQTIGISRLRMLNDGEGVTTLAAAYGCPLRCRYCLNPQCFEADHPLRTYSVGELLDEVRIDDLYFQSTGGGVVFGGGEPLLYAEFIHAFREAAPKQWKLGLESSLAVPAERLRTVLEDIDFYLIDVKDMDPEIYRAYTGRNNDLLMDNLKVLSACADPSRITVRLPLIRGFNTPGDQERSRKKLEDMGFCRFDLFRYNIEVAEEKRKKYGNAFHRR